MSRKILLAIFAGAALALTAAACGGGDNANGNTNANANRAAVNANANANVNANANANSNARNWNMSHEEYNKNESGYRAEAKGKGENIGQDLEDGWIHFKVRGALASASDVPSTGISVDVEKKVVTLRGTVATKDQKDKAEKAAHVDGAAKVVDRLEVKPDAGNKNAGNANSNAHAATNANKKG
ncbi:MAG TPA: BON domain-containing protein [Pyrinomonadaceae bacterium]|jgi:osmotically-inducible protein OsmY|nr:BON domain-containing protein [Pyrinomonadaceae bacterium]